MPRHIDRLFAASIALLVNGAAIWFLARSPYQLVAAQDKQVIEAPAIQIVWITRTSDKQLDKRAPANAAKRHTSARLVATDPAPARRQKPALTAVAIPAATKQSETAADDHSTRAASSTLDLGLPDTQLSFERDLLAHRTQPIVATPNRMHLTFTDHSIGGILQGMTKSSICGELRRSLFSAQGSADTIVKTMRDYGCIR